MDNGTMVNLASMALNVVIVGGGAVGLFMRVGTLVQRISAMEKSIDRLEERMFTRAEWESYREGQLNGGGT